MGKNLIISLLILALLIPTVSTASATAEITISPLTQDIYVGDIGTYTIKLITSDTGTGELKWKVEGSKITARIGGESFAKKGSISITNTPNVEQTFTLEVRPESGVEIGKPVDIEVSYKGPNNKGTKLKVKAKAEAGVVPVPELSTSALMSAGMVGLFGLVRMHRKD